MTRSMATFHGTSHWDRASRHGTVVTADGEIMLDRAAAEVPVRTDPEPEATERTISPLDVRASLAIDEACHLYRTDPSSGHIARYLIGTVDGRTSITKQLSDWLTQDPPTETTGAFRQPPRRPFYPTAIASDGQGRLWIASADSSEVVIYDRWSSRVIQRRSVQDHLGRAGEAGDTGGRRVIDLAATADAVYAVCVAPAGLVRLSLGSENTEITPPVLGHPTVPARVAGLDDQIAVLYVAADEPPIGEPWEGFVVTPGGIVNVDNADDIALQNIDRQGIPGHSLYVADGTGELITQFRFGDGGWRLERQMAARGYDGSGLVSLPDGSIAFWGSGGLQRPLAGRGRLKTGGRVTTLALDSRNFGSRWGRLFIDACIPPGTSIRIHAATSDDQELADQSLPAPGPEILPAGPPRIPNYLVPAADDVVLSLHHRAAGRPEPWSQPDEADRFETFEAPVMAEPGRYLWLTFELTGTGSATPRIRTVNAERSTHGHLQRLPRLFARDDRDAFLDRYLSMMTGVIDDLDAVADRRHVLLDPQAVPEDALPWLASFVGLVLDDRWPLAARRQLVAEATSLLSHRGTVWSLNRTLEILLGVAPIIVEHFRLRGIGGVLLSNVETPSTTSVLGAGFRVGGGLDDLDPSSTDDDDSAQPSAISDYAHRFSVLIPRYLTPDENDAIDHLLDTHRPAHTMVDVCELGVGMRVGRGLHLELSSLIGPTGDWDDAWVGRWHLGRNALLADLGSPRIPATIQMGTVLR